jgi:hypothetical protein
MGQRVHDMMRRRGNLVGRSVAIGTVVALIVGLLFGVHSLSGSRANAAVASDAKTVPDKFDHDATSFPLRGAHRILKCEQCHQGGQYKTLPTRCDNCHTGQLVYGKPTNHVVTTLNCDSCHSQSAWSPAIYQHDPATTAGQCLTCHNGQTATGKPQNHLPTTLQCDVCHTTKSWAFSHSSALTAGQCSNCHNGQIATGKPPTHMPTTGQCDQCHNTRNWIFSHTPALTAGQCSNCHNGQTATGKPPTHVPTTGQCDLCHKSTTAWLPAGFTHDATTAGRCSTCHNGQTATGKPTGHFGTTMQCDMCHKSTIVWLPISLSFHLPTRLIGGHVGLDCSACHVMSTGTVIYRDGTTYGSCANCHTRNYRSADTHTSIAVDANCANCHQHAAYTFGD